MKNCENVVTNKHCNIENQNYSQLLNILNQHINAQNRKIEYLQNLQLEINELISKFN